MLYILLAVILMAMDQRGHYIPRARAVLESAISPVYQLVDLPITAIRGMRTYTRSYGQLLQENQEQAQALLSQAGEVQRLEALEEENRRLRALLNASEAHEFSYQFAEMVQVNLDPLAHQVVIDRGARHGVFAGQAVIDGDGVMGQVEVVHASQSRVRLISDPEHALPVQILRTGQRTVAYGSGEANRLALPNLPVQSDIREGDVLITSGLGDRFPAGYPVGEVTLVERPGGAAFATVSARPLAALDRGREVLLVRQESPP